MAAHQLPQGFILAAGETIVCTEELAASLLLFFLKVKVAATNRRIVAQWPNTFLGLIPVGSNAVTYPLANIASVGTGTTILIGNLIVGVLLALAGLSQAQNLWFLLLIGVLLLVNAFPASFVVTNNAGQRLGHSLAIFEKGKATDLANQINAIIAGR